MKNGKPISFKARLERLEGDVKEIKAMLQAQQVPKQPWWEEMIGVFADDPVFDEIDRLGREIREKERKKARRAPSKAKAVT